MKKVFNRLNSIVVTVITAIVLVLNYFHFIKPPLPSLVLWILGGLFIIFFITFLTCANNDKTKLEKKIFEICRNQVVRIITSIVVSIGAIAALFFYTTSQFGNIGDIIGTSFNERYAIIDSAVRSASVSDSSKLPEINQLKEQYRFIAKVKPSYLVVAKNYNKYGLSFTLFSAIFSVLFGILTFLILRMGWQNSEIYLKILFLVAFFSLTIFGVLPKVFDNDKNTRNNLTKYLFYSGLQIHIYNLIKDNKDYLKRNDSASLANFRGELSHINDEIRDSQNLFFDTHIDQVPGKYDILGESNSHSNDSSKSKK
ncbi:MAG: hypothetical protein LBE82_10425 [Chitinophagaceae bacterium]|jgi:magnesium-transporting ATPase (P-type)|nr:hypothetical protein [Chitinophagaceae bacterium]